MENIIFHTISSSQTLYELKHKIKYEASVTWIQES